MSGKQFWNRINPPILLLVSIVFITTFACTLPGLQSTQPPQDDLKSTIAPYERQIARLHTQVAGLETLSAYQATKIMSHEQIISYLATRVPVGYVTPIIGSPTPYRPIYGSVLIEGGRCCVGGTAGEMVEVEVYFEATSPFGEVTEMRSRIGALSFSEEEMVEAAWEPFVTTKTYEVPVYINWVGYYVSVQYRDAGGNLSPVYVDDISVEGQPAQTTTP